jgi:hydroxymethylglutaryl-CoA lyase
MQLPDRVEIVEVGPRDGLQNEATHVPTPDKIALIAALTAAGLRRFEATSFVSPKWIPRLADAEAVLAALPPSSDTVYGGLIPNERGYERARIAGVREVSLVVSATEGHCRANLNRSVAEVLGGFAPIAKRGAADGIRVRANISTVFGCPFDGVPPLAQVLTVIERIVRTGIDNITLSDTIGVANPRQVGAVFTAAHAAFPETTFAAHFHDTRRLALANVVAALDAGVRIFDSSIGGLGGCPYAPGAAGNVATEDLAFMLAEMGISTGIDLGPLLDAAAMVERLVGHPLRAGITRDLIAAPTAVST